jgi:hypothetical protein
MKQLRTGFRYGLLLVLPLWIAGCAPKLDVPEPDPGRADFSWTAAFGGTILSGQKDGALYAEGQQTSIPALVAKQLTHVGAGPFVQSLIPEGLSLGLNPYPWDSPYQSKSRMGDRTDCNGEVSLGPVKDTLSEADFAGTSIWDKTSGELHDFTVPGSGLWDLDKRNLGDDHLMGGPSVFASRFPFMGSGRSILEQMLQPTPSFLICWPGMDEMWNWASKGGYGVTLPSALTFRAKLDSVLSVLTSGGAKGVLATIPDVDNIPFFTTIPTRALELTAGAADSLNDFYAIGNIQLNFQEGENGFVVEDSTSQYGIRQLTEDDYLTLTVPLDSMKCYYMGVLFTLIPDRCSLIATELAVLRNTIAGYNDAIRDLAVQYDFALADMESYYATLKSGIRFDAVDFNTEFGSGGFFSLDGFGPNAKGAGLIANQFIAAINAHYGATVPLVQIDDLDGVLFP